MWIYVLILIVIVFFILRKTVEKFERNCMPPLPTPIDSNQNMKKMLKHMGRCENCLHLEKKLMHEGEKMYPNLVKKYPTNCDTCTLLLKGWERYFYMLSELRKFIDTGKLPLKPPLVTYSCPGCSSVQKKAHEYSEKVRAETMCIIQGKKCPKVRIPTEKHDRKCPECENVYEIWTVYTFILMNIGKYLLCKNNGT